MAEKESDCLKTLRAIQKELVKLRKRVDELGAPPAFIEPTPLERYQGPRRHRYGPKEPTKTFSIRATASATRKSLESVTLTKTVQGINELDARVQLAQILKGEGLYLGIVLSIVEVLS